MLIRGTVWSLLWFWSANVDFINGISQRVSCRIGRFKFVPDIIARWVHAFFHDFLSCLKVDLSLSVPCRVIEIFHWYKIYPSQSRARSPATCAVYELWSRRTERKRTSFFLFCFCIFCTISHFFLFLLSGCAGNREKVQQMRAFWSLFTHFEMPPAFLFVCFCIFNLQIDILVKLLLMPTFYPLPCYISEFATLGWGDRFIECDGVTISGRLQNPESVFSGRGDGGGIMSNIFETVEWIFALYAHGCYWSHQSFISRMIYVRVECSLLWLVGGLY